MIPRRARLPGAGENADMAGLAATLLDATARGVVSGAVALVVDRDGPRLQAAAGRPDLDSDAAMGAESVFAIASMTKPIVSVAALQLVEQGRLALDAPIAEVLPALAAPSVLEGFDASGAPVLRPARGPITLRHLLTHTAGYGYPMWNATLARYLEALGLPRIPTDCEQLRRMPLLFDPGTRWNYGINTDLVGLAVEAASGQTLAAYLQVHVLGPLGMHDTTFLLTPAQRLRLARMHARTGSGGLRPLDWPAGEGQGFTGGGGGLCSTAPDYGRFLRMLLNGGTLDGARLLRPETVEDLGRNQLGALPVTKLVSAMPYLSNDADLLPGIAQKWSLGFLLNTAPGPNGRSTGSLAWAGIGNCYFWIDRTAGVAGCLLAQVLPFADPAVLELFGAVERAAYAGLFHNRKR